MLPYIVERDVLGSTAILAIVADYLCALVAGGATQLEESTECGEREEKFLHLAYQVCSTHRSTMLVTGLYLHLLFEGPRLTCKPTLALLDNSRREAALPPRGVINEATHERNAQMSWSTCRRESGQLAGCRAPPIV